MTAWAKDHGRDVEGDQAITERSWKIASELIAIGIVWEIAGLAVLAEIQTDESD